MERRILIPNADDFGLSHGINQGIIEAHEGGILTSASLMVHHPAAESAAALASAHPNLAVGLHFDLGEWTYHDGAWRSLYSVVDPQSEADVEAELERQLARFVALIGREPSHLDSHQHIHLREPVRRAAIRIAERLDVPLRHCSPVVRYCGRFYGQTAEGAPHHDILSIAGFRRIVSELGAGIHELGCYPGYGNDLEPSTMYREERELELAVFCAADTRRAVSAAGFALRSFGELANSK